MMKLKNTLVIALVIMTQSLFCQVSNVVEGSKWKEVRCNYWTSLWLGIYHVDNWRIEGDTIFNGIAYKKIYNYQEDYKYGIIYGKPEDSLVNTSDYFFGGIREENQKVYIYSNEFWYQDPNDISEKLMFDYSASIGDTITIWCRYYYLDYVIEDIVPTLMKNGNTRNKFILGPPGPGMVDMNFIEGIGSSYGFIGSYIATTNDQMQHLLCFSINDTIVLENTPEYTSNCLVDPIQESCNSVVLSSDESYHPAPLLIIYPNPASSELIVKIEKSLSLDISYNIYTPAGKKALSATPFTNEMHHIDVSMLPSGVYFLEVVFGDSKKVVRKFLINN